MRGREKMLEINYKVGSPFHCVIKFRVQKKEGLSFSKRMRD